MRGHLSIYLQQLRDLERSGRSSPQSAYLRAVEPCWSWQRQCNFYHLNASRPRNWTLPSTRPRVSSRWLPLLRYHGLFLKNLRFCAVAVPEHGSRKGRLTGISNTCRYRSLRFGCVHVLLEKMLTLEWALQMGEWVEDSLAEAVSRLWAHPLPSPGLQLAYHQNCSMVVVIACVDFLWVNVSGLSSQEPRAETSGSHHHSALRSRYAAYCALLIRPGGLICMGKV